MKYLAEWAIARLQVEAGYRIEALQKGSNGPGQSSNGSTSQHSEAKSHVVEIGRYPCASRGHHGELCVSSEGVKYISAVRKRILWELRFDETKIMNKVGAGEGLLFVDTDDDEYLVSGLKARNEVFTQIVGYSGLRWQVAG